MKCANTIKELATALSIVQGKLTPAIKDASNPFYKSKYADLNSVWDSCRALLAENGLSVTQLNQITLDGVIIETVLMHSSGVWISGELFLPLTKADAQGVGSAMTYGRRYGLAAIIGIVSDEDDDGNAASQPKQQQKTQPAKPETPIAERIKNVSKAIKDLGGRVEPKAKDETDQTYFESLVEQWNRLK